MTPTPNETSPMPDNVTDDQHAALPEFLDDEPTPRTGLIRFARMAGSSIAGPDAAPWVTDFLNAAYYRRPTGARDVDDLRLAFCILTTYWHGKPRHRRLHLTDLRAFHQAFGHDRFATGDTARGTLDRVQLLDGAARLIGPWFPAAYADDERRGWGIAFETLEARAAYDPACRMDLARLGALTPESPPLDRQVWHTYPPVKMPSAERVVAALTAPETWPDYATEIGRFTPLRAGGLDGQTFEIEVAAGTEQGLPSALADLAAQLVSAGRAGLHLQVDPAVRMPPACVAAAYRLVQDLLGQTPLNLCLSTDGARVALALDAPLPDPRAWTLRADALGGELVATATTTLLLLPTVGDHL